MDFTSRRPPSSTSKSRFPNLSFLSGVQKSNGSPSKNASRTPWSAAAPGLAKRQSQSEWLPKKSSAEYSRIPKLSPTNDNIPGSGRASQLSSGSSGRYSNSSEPPKVLYDDTEGERENDGGMDIKGRFCDDDDNEMEAFESTIVDFPKKDTARSPDLMSTDSSRVAQRLASASSPAASRNTNLISFKPDTPEELLIDTDSDPISASTLNGNCLFSMQKDVLNATLAASQVINATVNERNWSLNRPKTSLEAIRQQIRQIESEIVSNRSLVQNVNGIDTREDGLFCSPNRPLQPSYSSQSIPANFNSDREMVSANGISGRNGMRGPYPHMQRAFSVDVAVHSALSDIQNAVKRNSTVRLKSSTMSIIERTQPPSQPGIQEEDDIPVWIKRDSAAQTEMQEIQPVAFPPMSEALVVGGCTPSPEMEEEMESESVYLLQETSLDPGNCDSRIGTLSSSSTNHLHSSHRPLSASTPSSTARRSSCQSAHELIEGVLFRCCYLGSTHLFSDSRPTKASRLTQAQEAVSRIKAPDGESQPMTDVDLFISIEKIMVLNVDIQDILMDHPLRTISYIADIGDLVVLMVKRGLEDLSCDAVVRSTQPRMLCHVFQSDEASLIAQTIGNAFQVAYMEYLKANGIQDDRYLRHLDYLEVLNSQEMSTHELELFAAKDKQNNVVIPKQKGEILGMVIVESGWGSMLPTVIIANMCPGGPAARCGKLSIGDQLISIDGISLVGLPLAQCQNSIKNVKNHTVVKLTVVGCPPVVEVKIKRPDTRYQLGFSVQNGIICSLLRGGIAERGGIRVGHRIIEINSQSVVATNHDMIVNMLAHSVGEIQLKTMPSSIFRLLTGQDMPVYI